ncbi:hypothetical protein JD969_13825 [Planctomycetota bacterium]|nr:hypothetical protein JD969_13825 [Planctomycetota bacterium]
MYQKIDVQFECDCGEFIEETVDAPYPDFSAEKTRDSVNELDQYVSCPACSVEHTLTVMVSFNDASCYRGECIEVMCDLPYDPDREAEEITWAIEKNEQPETFRFHMNNVCKILDLDATVECEFSLNVMVHGYLIAAIESYLSTTFIFFVTSHKELMSKLITTDPVFAKKNIKYKDLIVEYENLKVTVASYLNDLIFHKIDKVHLLYKNVLGIDIEDIGWLYRAISIRHDCAHRAGYSKDGKPVEISKKSLFELKGNLERLVDTVQANVYNVVPNTKSVDDSPFI